MNDRQREQARIRQARRRARLKEEGASVTVTLTKQEEAMLQELCRVRRPGRTTHASVGVELPVSAAFPVCQPARDHGVGAGHRLPRHCHAPGQESGPYPPSGQDGRGHPDPAFWIGAQSECSLPHAVSRRCVCRAIPRLSAFPLGQVFQTNQVVWQVVKFDGVDSICQCNTPFNYLFRCFELQCLSRSVV